MAARLENAVPAHIHEMGRGPTDFFNGIPAGFSGNVAFASLADETIALPTTLTYFNTKYTIPANTMRVGTVIRTRAWGRWGNGLDTAGLTLYFYMNTAPQRLLWGTPNVAPGFGTASSGIRFWQGESVAIIRSTGTNATYSYNSTAMDGTSNFSVSATAVVPFADYGGVNTTYDRDIRIAAMASPIEHIENFVLLGGMVVEVLQAQTTG